MNQTVQYLQELTGILSPTGFLRLRWQTIWYTRWKDNSEPKPTNKGGVHVVLCRKMTPASGSDRLCGYSGAIVRATSLDGRLKLDRLRASWNMIEGENCLCSYDKSIH